MRKAGGLVIFAASEFWTALTRQQNEGGGPFNVTPGNAPGNGTIGFFGSSAVSAIEAEVK